MSHHKKQKIDDGFAVQDQEDILAHELKAIKSAMQELLDNSRSQMTSIQAEMKGMRDEMKNLGYKCDAMEKSLQKSQNNDTGLLEQNDFRDRVDSRFDEVKNNLKYHEILLKNQKWEYSAPLPSSDEASNHQTRQFLEGIKEQTCDMRYGRNVGAIGITGHVGVPYNESFLPHWTEFTNALQEYQCMLKCLPKDVDTTFDLYDVELPHEVLDLLSNALESTHFKDFTLMRNNLGRDGIKFALKYMQNNPVLKEFCLYENSIDHNDDVNQLCEIIKEHPSIETIQLDDCFRRNDMDGHGTLCSIMTAGANKLKRIRFRWNSISTRGSTFLADFLASNPLLETLSLFDNELDDNDAISIASALNLNTNLQFLDLDENLIEDSGWKALHKAEFDDKSLTSAADSNHTCAIPNSGFVEINLNRDSDAHPFRRSALRSKKIYSVLSARNKLCSNVQHLEDGYTPIQFLPDILGAIQRYSEYHQGDNAPSREDDDVEALSLVFELMRRWDKAFSVFSTLGPSQQSHSMNTEG